MTADYPELLHRGKAIQRDNVVRLIFGGQTKLARLLRVTPSMINHLVWMRRRSDPIERYVMDAVRRARPDLVGVWERPAANGRKAA